MSQHCVDLIADGAANCLQAVVEAEARRAQDFWRHVQRFEPGAEVRRQGKLATAEKIAIVSGWACEMKLLPDGRRQIFAFLLPHEVANFTAAEEERRNIVALSRLEVIDWDAGVRGLSSTVASSWEESEAHRRSRMFDQIVRLGRLNAEERMLNLLLELLHRLRTADLLQSDTLKLPLTQELLADALGLSVVHINRTIQKLKAKGFITLRRGAITLHTPDRLARLACFETPASRLMPLPEDWMDWRQPDASALLAARCAG